MAYLCKLCGASLEVQPEDDIVKCEYCGGTTRVREPAAPQHAPPAQPAPSPSPHAPPEDVEKARLAAAMAAAAAAGPAKSGSAAALVAVLIPLLLAGAAGAWFLLGKAGVVAGEWYSPPCLVDANGDGVLDVGGWAGTPSNQRALTVVDGATGKRIWGDGRGWQQEDNVACLAGTHLAVLRPDFRVEVVSARDPASRYVMKLSDTVQRIAQGEGCSVFETSDRQSKAISVADGKDAECKAGGSRMLHEGEGATSLSFEVPEGRIADVAYRLGAKSPGTAFLTVTAEREQQILWKKQLAYTAGFVGKAGFAVTPVMIVVWGAPPGKDLFGVIVGLDPRDGSIRYEIPMEKEWSGAIDAFAYNGKYVVTRWSFGLHAYDPVTGEEAWSYGGR